MFSSFFINFLRCKIVLEEILISLILGVLSSLVRDITIAIIIRYDDLRRDATSS